MRRALAALLALSACSPAFAAGGTVTGRVLGQDGKPAANAEVGFFDADHSWYEFVTSVRTGGDGRYTFTLPTPEDQPACTPKEVTIGGMTYTDSSDCKKLAGQNTKTWLAAAFLPFTYKGAKLCLELDGVTETKFGQRENVVRDFKWPKEVWGAVNLNLATAGLAPRAKWTVKVRLTPKGPTWSGSKKVVEETLSTDDVRGGLALFDGIWVPLGEYDVQTWLVEANGSSRSVAVAARTDTQTSLSKQTYGPFGDSIVTKFFQRGSCHDSIVFWFGARAK
ncbi:hypothetical protein [Deinococcus yavapaiensis]|uniref:Carboxypeptidase family protein n=1 Tax=Deinococcus yavapaiensis KR-236 TaxID=694435 RepID=A0A318SR49_9DEIO|nr:hypothetical protein [Deinococcus yavapaiensis]PYE55403.1 hypothetical protein DES52_103236 [Deinococcus yavapaiensis KR-236]